MSNAPIERMLPQNVEAEKGVLGSLIIDPEAILQVEEFLLPEHFYRDAHRTIYAMIRKLSEQHKPADFITLCDALEWAGTLEDVGGQGYINSLVNCVPTSANVEHYGNIVHNVALLRRVISVGTQMVATAYTESDARKVIEVAEQLVYCLDQRKAASDFESDTDLVSAFMTRLWDMKQSDTNLMGVPTGFFQLDFLLGGLQRSDLIVLAARPAIGKSSLALSLARNVVKSGGRVGVFSLEMSKEQLIQRLVAGAATIDLLRLRNGQVKDYEWDLIMDAMASLSSGLLWIDDTAGLTPASMRSKVRRLTREGPVDLIIVDYLQLMYASSSDGGSRPENRVQEIDEVTRALKAIGKEFNVPVLALAQLSRAVEARTVRIPQLSDLRESGGIENNADVVMFIYRDEMYNPNSQRENVADIIIAKHRNGPIGEIQLGFHKETTKFENLPPGRTYPSLSTLYSHPSF